MYFQIARTGKNDWWRFVVTATIVTIALLLGNLPLVLLIFGKGAQLGLSDGELQDILATMDLSSLGIDQNLVVFMMLMPFAFALGGLFLAVKYVHERPIRTLITPKPKLDWHKIFFGFSVWMALAVIFELGFYMLEPANYSLQFDASKFFVLLLISVFVFPLQTSCEEIVFRGYLLQGLGLLIKNRWLPLLLTSVAFGTLHFANPEVTKYGLGLTMTYYIGVGLFLGFITLMDDSLELALGIHAATNIFSALFVTFDDSAIPTAAIFHTKTVNMSLMLFAFFISAALFVYIAAKKYGWQDWTKWHRPIEEQAPVAIEIPEKDSGLLDDGLTGKF